MWKKADIVLAPYNYILDPAIRKQVWLVVSFLFRFDSFFLSQMDIDGFLMNSIVVLDEAHNLEDCCRSATSMEIKDTHLFNASVELSQLRPSLVYYIFITYLYMPYPYD